MGDEDEWKKLPTVEKCVHKSWKARVEGYEEAVKEFTKLKNNPDSNEFSKYLGCIKKFVTDTNANAQEKGCEAALNFLEFSGCAKKAVKEIVSGVVAKGLNGKPKTKETCAKMVLMCVEIEQVVDAREEILEGFKSRQPKVVAAAVNIVTQCLNQFGSKVFPIKPLIQKDLLKPVLEHKDGKVRDEGKALVTEMYRWIGDMLPKLLTTLELKEVMLKELEEEWSKTEKGSPERYTRSEQKKLEEQEDEEEEVDGGGGSPAGGGGGGGEEEEDEDLDPYDMAEAVDILKKLHKDVPDFQSKLVDKSWKIRKEALDALLPLAEGTLKIEPNPDFGSIVTPLSKIIAKDANIVVCQLAAKCLAGIAKGLRKGYGNYAKETIISCLAKYKEKKATVVAILTDCIDSAMDSTQFANVSEHVIAALKDKNPAIRQETTNFCTRLFARSKASALPKTVMKALCPELKALLDDSVGPVRDAAATALGTSMKVVGEKFMSEYIADLDSIKKGKVTDCFEKAEVKYPYGAKGPATKAPAAAKAPPKAEASKKAAAAKAETEQQKKPAAKKTAAKKGGPAKKAPKKEAKAPTQSQLDNEEVTEPELGDDRVDEIAQELLSADIVSGLGNANWKVRLEAVQGFSSKVDGLDEKANVQALIQLLNRKPGFKDNNAQVLLEKFQIAEKTSKKSSFNKRTADYVISGGVEKIGDIKLKGQISETLLAIADAISLNFTSANVFEYAAKQKSPKIHIEVLTWLSEALRLFGMKIKLKSHVKYLKTCLESPNAQIRGAAMTLVGTIAMYSGGAILAAFSDLSNKNTVAQIESAVEQAKNEKPPTPTRGIKSGDGAGDGGEADEGGDDAEIEEDGEMDLEDLIERKDISASLEKLCETINSSVWKERAAALESIQNLITSTQNIKPELGSDFVAGMKARLADNNMAVKTKALGIMNSLGKALGPGTKKHKDMMVLLLPLLGDSKKHIQSQVIEALDVWGEHVTIRPLLVDENLVAPSTDNNPNLRNALFTWIKDQIIKSKIPPKLPKELNLIVPGLYKSLEDRNPDVRKSAQACLPYVMAHVGYPGMISKLDSLDQKSKQTVQDILEKNKEQADALAPKTKPKPKPVAAKSSPSPKKAIKSSTPPASEQDEQSDPEPPKKLLKKGAGKKPAPSSGAGNKRKKEDEDTESPLKPNDKKQQRFKDENSLKILKWNFKVPRAEYSEQLQTLMEPCCSSQLLAKLFNDDFKQHNEALKILIGIIPTHLNEIKQSLDLILKWISLRFFDTNTSVLLNSLDFLSKCVKSLVADGYILMEQEASAFMPYLVTKLGDSKEPVRKSVNGLFNELVYIYPESRIFTFLSDGLKSKNSRQRTGTLEHLTKIISESQNGILVCQPSPKKAFEYIAEFIGDKDTSVRTAALNCIVAGWNHIGDDIYKMCGRLNNKDMGMLEERVKRSGKRIEISPKQPARLKEVQPPAEKSEPEDMEVEEQEDMELDDVAVELEDSPPVLPPEPKPRGEFYINYENLLPVSLPVHEPMNPVSTEELSDFAIPTFNFKYNPVEQNLEGIDYRALEVIDFELVEKIGNLRHPLMSAVIETVSDINALLKDPNHVLKFKFYVNNLIMSATSQLTHFPSGEDDQETSLYRAMLGILMQCINNDELSAKISRKYIARIFKLFLPVLAEDHRSNTMIDVLVKGLNTLICRLLMNCNCGAATCALVSYMDDILDDRGVTKSHKELEILLKCLWKLMARIEKDFNLTVAERHELLICLATFLKRLPSQVWKDGHENDKPYRTIKTLLHRFCKCSGVRVLSDLETLPPEDSKTLKNQIDSFLTALGYDTANVDAVNTGTEEPTIDDKENLDTIFNGMNNVKDVQQSIQKLHRFKEDRPMVDISTYMNKLPNMKRKLVEKILTDMSKKKLKKHRLKLQILAELEGIRIDDLTEEQINNLNTKTLSDIITKDTRKILEDHDAKFNGNDMNVLIDILPKDKTNEKKPRLATSIPRPNTSPARSPVRSSGTNQLPSRSMDDLKKQLEMIKKRSRPT